MELSLVEIIISGLLLTIGLTWVFFLICEKANEVDWGNPWLNRLDGFVRLFCRHYHGLKYNPVKLNDHGAALVVANHISGLDPLLMIAASPRPLRFLIAREEYERFGLRWLFAKAGCIPVDRNKNPERALREAIRALKSGEIVALFPQGGIQMPGKRVKPLKGGAAQLAKMAQCPIATMHISGIHRWSAGKTMMAVLIPSSARIHCHEPVDCADLGKDACLIELENRILQTPT